MHKAGVDATRRLKISDELTPSRKYKVWVYENDEHGGDYRSLEFVGINKHGNYLFIDRENVVTHDISPKSLDILDGGTYLNYIVTTNHVKIKPECTVVDNAWLKWPIEDIVKHMYQMATGKVIGE